MASSVLVTPSWWRIVVERLARQAAQTAVPIIAALDISGGDVHLQDAATGIVIACALTLVKGILQAIANVAPANDEQWYWRWLDRAAPAFAGTFLGLIPAAEMDLSTVPWKNVLVASVASAALAVIALYAAPPAIVADPTTAPLDEDLDSHSRPRHRADTGVIPFHTGDAR